jgi:hypothetical protein
MRKALNTLIGLAASVSLAAAILLVSPRQASAQTSSWCSWCFAAGGVMCSCSSAGGGSWNCTCHMPGGGDDPYHPTP